MDKSKRINEVLRLTRAFHNLNQMKLANELQISRSYLSEIESGKRRVTISLLYKYDAVFGIPASSFMLFAESLDSEGKASELKEFAADKLIGILSWVAEGRI